MRRSSRCRAERAHSDAKMLKVNRSLAVFAGIA
jgi:hypothetical protein